MKIEKKNTHKNNNNKIFTHTQIYAKADMNGKISRTVVVQF